MACSLIYYEFSNENYKTLPGSSIEFSSFCVTVHVPLAFWNSTVVPFPEVREILSYCILAGFNHPTECQSEKTIEFKLQFILCSKDF